MGLLHNAVVPSFPTGQLIYTSGTGWKRPAFLNQHVDVYKNMRRTDVSPVAAAPSITVGAEGENNFVSNNFVRLPVFRGRYLCGGRSGLRLEGFGAVFVLDYSLMSTLR